MVWDVIEPEAVDSNALEQCKRALQSIDNRNWIGENCSSWDACVQAEPH